MVRTFEFCWYLMTRNRRDLEREVQKREKERKRGDKAATCQLQKLEILNGCSSLQQYQYVYLIDMLLLDKENGMHIYWGEGFIYVEICCEIQCECHTCDYMRKQIKLDFCSNL